MKSPDGASKSSWYAGVEIPRYPALGRSAHADVCVVGAGIAGLTTAYLLVSEGLNVIVLDEGPIGSGQTGRTSAHLASAIDDQFVEIEKMHGRAGLKLAYQSHAAAIDTIERISRDEKIDCDFKRVNGLLSPTSDDPPDYLNREFEAAKRAGFADRTIAEFAGIPEKAIRALRKRLGIVPIYKMVDTCAAEFEAATPYFYSCYDTEDEY